MSLNLGTFIIFEVSEMSLNSGFASAQEFHIFLANMYTYNSVYAVFYFFLSFFFRMGWGGGCRVVEYGVYAPEMYVIRDP